MDIGMRGCAIWTEKWEPRFCLIPKDLSFDRVVDSQGEPTRRASGLLPIKDGQPLKFTISVKAVVCLIDERRHIKNGNKEMLHKPGKSDGSWFGILLEISDQC